MTVNLIISNSSTDIKNLNYFIQFNTKFCVMSSGYSNVVFTSLGTGRDPSQCQCFTDRVNSVKSAYKTKKKSGEERKKGPFS